MKDPKLLQHHLMGDDDCVLHIGIDLGTKFSAAVFRVVQGGKGSGNHNAAAISKTRNVLFNGNYEVPTEAAVLCSSDGNKLIFGQEIESNLGISEIGEQDIFRQLKLSLVSRDEPRFRDDRELLNGLRQQHQVALSQAIKSRISGISSLKDVFREFLRWFWSYVKDDIPRRSPISVEELARLLSNNNVKIAVAVPAIWTEDMIDEFYDLALDAGIPHFHICSEPKSAAAVVARQIEENEFADSNILAKCYAQAELEKSIFVILDIGHGTADLTTFCIRELQPKLQITALFMGTGSLWGAIRLNDIFKQHIRKVITPVRAKFFQRLSSTDPSIPTGASVEDKEVLFLEKLTRGFERAKETFPSPTNQSHKILYSSRGQLPEMPHLNIYKGSIAVSQEDMAAIFDNYLEHIYELVDHQLQSIKGLELNEPVITIIAVGGGCLNTYITDKLQDRYNNKQARISVLAPGDRAFSLVAKGAYLTTIDPTLGRRDFARSSFGVPLEIDFDSTIHNRKYAKQRDFPPFELAMPNVVDWVIKLGQNVIEPLEPMMIEGHIQQEVFNSQIQWPITFKQEIFRCDNPALIAKFSKKPVDRSKLATAGVLLITLYESDCDLKIHGEPGRQYVEIAFRILARWTGIKMEWQLVIPYRGDFPSLRDKLNHGPRAIVKTVELSKATKYDLMDLDEDWKTQRERSGSRSVSPARHGGIVDNDNDNDNDTDEDDVYVPSSQRQKRRRVG